MKNVIEMINYCELEKTGKLCGIDNLKTQLKKYSGYKLPEPIVKAFITAGIKPRARFFGDTMVKVSETDSTKISYFKDRVNFARGLRTRTTLAKYLKKYSDLSDQDIRNINENFVNNQIGYIFELTNKQDQIVSIYRDRLTSCMNNQTDYVYAYDHEVIKVYATPDIKIAALYDRNGRLLGRAVCNEVKKIYAEKYTFTGYSDLFDEYLFNAGYEQDPRGIAGCRILKIDCPDHDGYLMPYIDGDGYFIHDHDDQYFTAQSHGGDQCLLDNQTTDGRTEYDQGQWCDHCDSYTDDSLTYVESEQYHVCESCLSEHFVFAIIDWRENTGYILTENTAYSEHEREYYSKDLMGDLIVYSETENDYRLESDCVYSNWHDDYILLENAVLCRDELSDLDYIDYDDTGSDYFTVKDGVIKFYSEYEDAEKSGEKRLDEYVHDLLKSNHLFTIKRVIKRSNRDIYKNGVVSYRTSAEICDCLQHYLNNDNLANIINNHLRYIITELAERAIKEIKQENPDYVYSQSILWGDAYTQEGYIDQVYSEGTGINLPPAAKRG